MEEDIKNNEEFKYFNDEWNGIRIKDIKIKEIDNKYQWMNHTHWLYEMYSVGKISKEELNLRLKTLK